MSDVFVWLPMLRTRTDKDKDERYAFSGFVLKIMV
jgi:hypothetical protein